MAGEQEDHRTRTESRRLSTGDADRRRTRSICAAQHSASCSGRNRGSGFFARLITSDSRHQAVTFCAPSATRPAPPPPRPAPCLGLCLIRRLFSRGENQMKAVYFERFGGPEVLQYGDLPDPIPAAGEIIVDFAAARVNAADWKFRSGHYARHSQANFPLIPGRDFSGQVSALGRGIDDLKGGDAVFGVLEAGREGTYAEKLATKAAIVAKKPQALSHVQAAALALTGLTAVNAIADTLKLQRGETILIQGG